MSENTDNFNVERVIEALIKLANLQDGCKDVKTLNQLINITIPQFPAFDQIKRLSQEKLTIHTLQFLHNSINVYFYDKKLCLHPSILRLNFEQILNENSPNHTTSSIMLILSILASVMVDNNSSKWLFKRIQKLQENYKNTMQDIAQHVKSYTSVLPPPVQSTPQKSIGSSRKKDQKSLYSGIKNIDLSRQQIINKLQYLEEQRQQNIRQIQYLSDELFSSNENIKSLLSQISQKSKNIKQLSFKLQEKENQLKEQELRSKQKQIYYQKQQKIIDITTQNFKKIVDKYQTELAEKNKIIQIYLSDNKLSNQYEQKFRMLEEQERRFFIQLDQKQQNIKKYKQQIEQKNQQKLRYLRQISDLTVIIHKLQIQKDNQRRSNIPRSSPSRYLHNNDQEIILKRNLRSQYNNIEGCGQYIKSQTNTPVKNGEVVPILQRSKQDSSEDRQKKYYKEIYIQSPVRVVGQSSPSPSPSPYRRLIDQVQVKQFYIQQQNLKSSKKRYSSKSPIKQFLQALTEQNGRNNSLNHRNSRRSASQQLSSSKKPIQRSLKNQFNQPNSQNISPIPQNKQQNKQRKTQLAQRTPSNNIPSQQQLNLMKFLIANQQISIQSLKSLLCSKQNQIQSYRSLISQLKTTRDKNQSSRLKQFIKQVKKTLDSDFTKLTNSTYNDQDESQYQSQSQGQGQGQGQTLGEEGNMRTRRYSIDSFNQGLQDLQDEGDEEDSLDDHEDSLDGDDYNEDNQQLKVA